MSSYYMAPIGDVMNAAPPGLKLSSQSIVVLDQDVLPDEAQLSDALFTLYESLRGNQKLSLDEVRSILGVKIPCPWSKSARTRLGHLGRRTQKRSQTPQTYPPDCTFFG